MTLPMVLTTLIFAAGLFLILTEKLHRTIVAVSGAALTLALGLVLRFYTEEQALQAIDFETVGLLLGMMIMVAMLEPTGFFQFLAVWAGRLSKGRPLRLMILLGTITTLLSMFLDNVTTVVLIAPVTILISEILGVSAAPLLMAEALLSDTGGVATLIGDPPNVLIASAADFSFVSFLTHALPVVIVAWLVTLMLLMFLFRADLRLPPTDAEVMLKLNPTQAFTDPSTARRVLIILVAALILFFFENALGITPAFIALSAAAAALIWVRPNVTEVFRHIEWGVLIFFIGLFVMVGGLQAAGVLANLTLLLDQLNALPLVWVGVVLIWVTALLSAVVDNVPITIAMIPVIQGLGASGINIQPLWWAVVFGAGLGGNGTIIGSTANIIVASLSEKTRTPITSTLWNKRGLPVMLATCAVASIFYVLLFSWMSQR